MLKKNLIRIAQVPNFSTFKINGIKFEANPQKDSNTNDLKYYTLKFSPVNRKDPPIRFWPKYLQTELVRFFIDLIKNPQTFEQLKTLIEEIEYVNKELKK